MDPLGAVYLGKAGTGAAVFLGDPSISSKELSDRLGDLRKQRTQESKSIETSMDDLLKFEKTEWYQHKDEIQEMREGLVTHVTGYLANEINPFTGKIGAITNTMQGNMRHAIEYSTQLKEYFDASKARFEGKQQDFTVDSITDWVDYWKLPFKEQLEKPPPILIEKQERVDYLTAIDKLGEGIGYDITQYPTEEAGVQVYTKQAKENYIKLRTEDFISVDPKGKLAVADYMQIYKISREQAEKRIEDRVRSGIDSTTKLLEKKGTTYNYTYYPWGAESKNYRFEVQEVKPTVGIGTVLTGGVRPQPFTEISLTSKYQAENKPHQLRDPEDPTKTKEIWAIPLSVRQEKGGEWTLHGIKEGYPGGGFARYTEDYDIPWEDVKGKIRGKFDNFDPDIIMKNYLEKRGETPAEIPKSEWEKYKR